MPLLLIGLPVGLVLLEPDLGSALVIAAVGVGMVLVRGVPRRHLLLAALSALLLLRGWCGPTSRPIIVPA